MKSPSRSNDEDIYSSDIPIDSKRQDLLKRSPFAERLANDLTKVDTRKSIVVGLYGAWGSGKTSIKNLILEANKKKGASSLTVVDFNPWQLSGTGGIGEAFFSELGIALTPEATQQKAGDKAKLLAAYGKSLRLAGGATNTIGKLLPLIGVPMGPLLSSAGETMRTIGEGVAEGSDALQAHEEIARKSLKDQKMALSKKLLNMERPILVVIDDIDRLSSSEILQIFQLVKANADFPNLIYLLLFERRIVAEALNKISGGRGMEFLEKIVQVGYHIPEASRRSLERTLFAGIDREIERKEIEVYWESSRWSDLYPKGLSGFFHNLRHVRRFLSSFGFQVRHHLTGGSFEVNPVDLIGLEALRVFAPDVYELLQENRLWLTGQPWQRSNSEQKDWRSDLINQLCASVEGEQKRSITKVLKVLFPRLEGEHAGEEPSANYRKNRICHFDVFPKYFTLMVDDDDLTRHELDELLAAAADPKRFESISRSYHKRGLLKVALNRLEEYKEQYDPKLVPEVIAGMSSIEDCLERGSGFSDERMEYNAVRFAYFGLKRMPTPEERLHALLEGLKKSKGIYIPLDLIALEERTERSHTRSQPFFINESDMPILIQSALSKIRIHSKKRSFRNHPFLHWLLWRWGEWSTPAEVRSWVESKLTTPRDAVWLLVILVGEVHSHGIEYQIYYKINLETVERFTRLALVTKLVNRLRGQKLSKKEKFAVTAYKKALIRRAEGKSDDWYDREDPELTETIG